MRLIFDSLGAFHVINISYRDTLIRNLLLDHLSVINLSQNSISIFSRINSVNKIVSFLLWDCGTLNKRVRLIVIDSFCLSNEKKHKEKLFEHSFGFSIFILARIAHYILLCLFDEYFLGLPKIEDVAIGAD